MLTTGFCCKTAAWASIFITFSVRSCNSLVCDDCSFYIPLVVPYTNEKDSFRSTMSLLTQERCRLIQSSLSNFLFMSKTNLPIKWKSQQFLPPLPQNPPPPQAFELLNFGLFKFRSPGSKGVFKYPILEQY